MAQTQDVATGLRSSDRIVGQLPSSAADASISQRIALPSQALKFPEFRYMGSKHRLLEWIHQIFAGLKFQTAFDPFVGSGSVAYLLKCMGKRVFASDVLNFPTVIATAAIANSKCLIDASTIDALLRPVRNGPKFIQTKFNGIFFSTHDLKFLDRAIANTEKLDETHQRAIAKAALIRACLKKQPRGVFTISGDLSRYHDGRRDLKISLEQHFIEQIAVFNSLIFDNGEKNEVRRSDVFDLNTQEADLVYLDPPYVPRSDDNCYVKRYHFLEGLSCYWKGLRIMEDTKVKKIEKIHSAFGSRKTALDAFRRLFEQFQRSIIVLSYSSNGYRISRCWKTCCEHTNRKLLSIPDHIATTSEPTRASREPASRNI